jgi:hypothetical protein
VLTMFLAITCLGYLAAGHIEEPVTG